MFVYELLSEAHATLFVYVRQIGGCMFDDSPFHLMRVILQEHGARWSERLPELTKPQYAVLAALDAAGALDQTALGEASATTKATLAEMLVRMERRGLIERHASAGDARRRAVHLTEEGARTLAAARAVADEVNGRMLAALDEQEREQLSRLLARLRRS